MKYRIMIAQFPGGWSNVQQSHPDVSAWVVETVLRMRKDPVIEQVCMFSRTGHYVPGIRNLALKAAREQGCDYILMADSDMSPDIPVPGAKPFWKSSWEFIQQHRDRPCMIAAPYCGTPPHENIFVFCWRNLESDNPNLKFSLEQLTREEAFARGGIEAVGALPTGLILIDLRVLDHLKPPYFYYEFPDEEQTGLASTEDVVFTRNASLVGCPAYCNWDAWAGHYKLKLVGKPQPVTIEQISNEYRRVIEHNVSMEEKLVMVGEGQTELQPWVETNKINLPTGGVMREFRNGAGAVYIQHPGQPAPLTPPLTELPKYTPRANGEAPMVFCEPIGVP